MEMELPVLLRKNYDRPASTLYNLTLYIYLSALQSPPSQDAAHRCILLRFIVSPTIFYVHNSYIITSIIRYADRYVYIDK